MNFEECKKIVDNVISKRDSSIIEENLIWHKHHIIPKHFNGTNDDFNLIKVTSQEHAEIHKKLFEKYNHKEDWLAWQGLSGFLAKEEIIKESIKIGQLKAAKLAGKKTVETGRIYEMSKMGIAAFRNKFKSEEEYKSHFSKISKFQNGKPKESLKNYFWITDGNENKKIKKDSDIPFGFYKGRTKKWVTRFSTEQKENVTCPYCNKTGGKPVMKRFHFENCKNK